ncbi:hypothetical protein CR513_13081, partial [Mucuna pruriens]
MSHSHVDIVENENYIPTNKEGVEIPRSSWKEEQKAMYFINSKAINFFMCALIESEYEKIHSCKSSKEMWNTLALTYERHFKSKCPNLEKEEENEKKKPFIKKKESLMATWRDLDLSSSKDEDEKVKLCLMTNTTSGDEDDEKWVLTTHDRQRVYVPRPPSKKSQNSVKLKDQAQMAMLSKVEPKNIEEALLDDRWILVMQEELDQF